MEMDVIVMVEGDRRLKRSFRGRDGLKKKIQIQQISAD